MFYVICLVIWYFFSLRELLSGAAQHTRTLSWWETIFSGRKKKKISISFKISFCLFGSFPLSLLQFMEVIASSRRIFRQRNETKAARNRLKVNTNEILVLVEKTMLWLRGCNEKLLAGCHQHVAQRTEAKECPTDQFWRQAFVGNSRIIREIHSCFPWKTSTSLVCESLQPPSNVTRYFAVFQQLLVQIENEKHVFANNLSLRKELEKTSFIEKKNTTFTIHSPFPLSLFSLFTLLVIAARRPTGKLRRPTCLTASQCNNAMKPPAIEIESIHLLSFDCSPSVLSISLSVVSTRLSTN